jgi:hypothetical protein
LQHETSRAVFHDAALDSKFERDGFVVTRLLEPEAAEALRSDLHAIDDRIGPVPLKPGDILSRSFFHPDTRHRSAVDDVARAYFEPRLLGLLKEYRLLGVGTMTKQGGAGEMEIHRDWAITREEGRPAISSWLALDATTPENGALAVLAGSQRLPNIETLGVDSGYERFSARLKRRSQMLSVAPGEAVLFDNRLLHWAARNKTNRPRHAMRGFLLPAEEPHIFYRLDQTAGESRFHLLDVSVHPVIASDPGDVEEDGKRASLGWVPNGNRELSYKECEHLLGGGAPTVSGPAVLRRIARYFSR